MTTSDDRADRQDSLGDGDTWLDALLREAAAPLQGDAHDEQAFVGSTMQRLRQETPGPRGLSAQEALTLTSRRLRQQAVQIRALWLGALAGGLLATLLFWALGGLASASGALLAEGRPVPLLPWLALLPTVLLAWLSLSSRET